MLDTKEPEEKGEDEISLNELEELGDIPEEEPEEEPKG